jgi:hypothetical protein
VDAHYHKDKVYESSDIVGIDDSHDDSLLKIDSISDIVAIDEVPSLDEHNQET